MEKGSGGGSSLLGWTGLLGLIVGVGVGAALGYLEIVRRSDMHDMSLRIYHLQAEIIMLRNTTDQLQKEIQTLSETKATEKRIEDDKTSPQYYDDDDPDYYDDDSYDEYDPEQTGAGDATGGSGVPKNRTRRNLLEELLHRKTHKLYRRAVDSGSDKYNLIISQGPRRPSAPRTNDVKAVVYIDPIQESRQSVPGVVRPPHYYHHNYRTTRRPRLFRPDSGNFQASTGVKEEQLTTPDCCSMLAVHYASDSTRFRHPHGGHRSRYDGESDTNHRMAHHGGKFMDWIPHSWSGILEENFRMNNGNLTIITPGLYFVYAQIYYADVHDTSGFKLYLNNEALFQCSVTSVSSEEKIKRNSCYTGGLTRLQNLDSLWLKEIEGERYSVFEPTKSFFGLYRVANI